MTQTEPEAPKPDDGPSSHETAGQFPADDVGEGGGPAAPPSPEAPTGAPPA